MSNEIDPVILELRVEAEGAKVSLKDYRVTAEKEMALAEGKIVMANERSSASFNKLGSRVAAWGAGLAVAAGVGIVALAANFAKQAAEMKKTADGLGVTTDALQEYSYAATDAGIDQEVMHNGLAKLNDQLGKAALGAKQPSKIFKTLGIDIKDAAGQTRSAADVLPQLADRLNAISDPAQRASTATLLFGDNAAKLAPLLDQGSAGIDNLRDAAHRLGIVLSEKQIQEADQIASKLRDLWTVMTANVQSAIVDNADAVLSLASAFAQAANKAGEFLTAMRDVMKGADKVKADKGYWAFLNTEFGELRAAGAGGRRLGSIMGTRPEGLRAPPSGNTPNVSGILAPDGPRAPKPPKDHTAQQDERFRQALASEQQNTLSAQRALSEDVSEQAKLERRALEMARVAAQGRVAAMVATTDSQREIKGLIAAQIDETAAAAQSAINRRERAALDRQSLEARRENDRYEHDALQASADLADTRKDSLAAERRILDFMEQREQAELEAAIAAGKIADATKARADLETAQSARRTGIERDHEGPLARRSREIGNIDIDDEKQQIAIDAMDRFADSTANAAAEYLKLGGIAGDVINGIIQDLVRLAVQQTIVKPLMNAVGGFFGVGNLASGTDFAHGGAYRVGEAGPETVILPQGAKVIPNTRTAAAGGGSANVTQVLQFDLSNAVLTPDLLAQMNQMAQSAAVGGAMAGANLAQSNIARKGRQRLP